MPSELIPLDKRINLQSHRSLAVIYVDGEEDLRALYRHSTLFSTPFRSLLLEVFVLPVLELSRIVGLLMHS